MAWENLNDALTMTPRNTMRRSDRHPMSIQLELMPSLGERKGSHRSALGGQVCQTAIVISFSRLLWCQPSHITLRQALRTRLTRYRSHRWMNASLIVACQQLTIPFVI